jgi:hypothetical protein
MEFNIKRDLFSMGIQKTLGIVEKKTTMPILSNLLLRAGQNRVTIMATDRETTKRRSSGKGRLPSRRENSMRWSGRSREIRSMLLKMKGMLSF